MSNNVVLELGRKIKQASASAINRAAQTAVTAASKMIRERYNFKKRDLDSSIKIISKASQEEPVVKISIGNAPFSLMLFNARQIGKAGRPRKGRGPRYNQGVKATVIKGKRTLFRSDDKQRGSFIAEVKSGKQMVFIRNKANKPTPLFGPRLTQLFVGKRGESLVVDKMREVFSDTYSKRLEHEVSRRMNT